jgi:hypothetical protein
LKVFGGSTRASMFTMEDDALHIIPQMLRFEVLEDI